jgi:hypothetical protein
VAAAAAAAAADLVRAVVDAGRAVESAAAVRHQHWQTLAGAVRLARQRRGSEHAQLAFGPLAAVGGRS